MYASSIFLALFVAALGAGLMAGVYFAFSAFIMHAFDQLGPARAADAMNAVNDVILRSWFMALFFGTSLLHAILATIAVFDTDLAGRWWLFAAGSVYVAGMFLCTVVFNVPLNDRLAAEVDDDRRKAETWQRYFVVWTRWNHLRAVCSLIAAAIGIHWLASHG